jgi:hypothetical protein
MGAPCINAALNGGIECLTKARQNSRLDVTNTRTTQNRCDDSLIDVSERTLPEGLGVGWMGKVPLLLLTLKSGDLHENE